MGFDILGPISNVELIAKGRSIRGLRALQLAYGQGRWRKLKGVARIRLDDDSVWLAELHWYECHGIGQKDFKIKRYLELLAQAPKA